MQCIQLYWNQVCTDNTTFNVVSKKVLQNLRCLQVNTVKPPLSVFDLQTNPTPPFLTCSWPTCLPRGESANRRLWSLAFSKCTVWPPAGSTVRRATSWRTATAGWCTCLVSAAAGLTSEKFWPCSQEFIFSARLQCFMWDKAALRGLILIRSVNSGLGIGILKKTQGSCGLVCTICCTSHTVSAFIWQFIVCLSSLPRTHVFHPNCS